MYNRYVPQADGSYRRNKMEERETHHRPVQQQKPQPQPVCSPPREECAPQMPKEHPHHQGQNVTGFLRQLLPKDFDTADLIIVLLLLLLAGDCHEDKSTAMLTLVLYLFM